MNTKKKILFLVTQSEFGGAQRFIYRLITGLDLSNYDISVAAGPEGNNAEGLLFNLKGKGFRVFPLKFLKRSINPVIDLWGFFEINNLIKKQNPDIVFLCSTKAGILGSFAAKINRKKVIYRIGGWTFNDPWPDWKKNIYLWLEKKTAKFKDFIVNNSSVEKEQAIKLGIKPKKEILTIYNGIDAKSLKFLSKEEARSKISETLKSTQNSKFKIQNHLIGTVANFYPAKGLEYLIEAADLLKSENIQFIIIGDGQGREKLENLIKNKGLDNVLLTGSIPGSYKYLRAFDAFVLPSLKEGSPWTVIEAMAAEIPVIATKVGAVPEIIEDEESGILIEPKNHKAMAEAIKKIINDKSLSEKLARNGKKVVEENFNIEKMIKKYEDLFFIN